MDSTQKKILHAIKHYQKTLLDNRETGNTEKLLHAIDKLSRLPIQLRHLEETHVGRTVNSLKKLGDVVGRNARNLVDKWRAIVEKETAEEEDDEEQEDVDEQEEDPYNQESDEEKIDYSHQDNEEADDDESHLQIYEREDSVGNSDSEPEEKPRNDINKYNSSSHKSSSSRNSNYYQDRVSESKKAKHKNSYNNISPNYEIPCSFDERPPSKNAHVSDYNADCSDLNNSSDDSDIDDNVRRKSNDHQKENKKRSRSTSSDNSDYKSKENYKKIKKSSYINQNHEESLSSSSKHHLTNHKSKESKDNKHRSKSEVYKNNEKQSRNDDNGRDNYNGHKHDYKHHRNDNDQKKEKSKHHKSKDSKRNHGDNDHNAKHKTTSDKDKNRSNSRDETKDSHHRDEKRESQKSSSDSKDKRNNDKEESIEKSRKHHHHHKTSDDRTDSRHKRSHSKSSSHSSSKKPREEVDDRKRTNYDDSKKTKDNSSESNSKRRKEHSDTNDRISSKEKKKESTSSTPNKKISNSTSVKSKDGIDSESGASFADALGMLEPFNRNKKKTSNSTNVSYEKDKEKHSKKSDFDANSRSTITSSTNGYYDANTEKYVPEALNKDTKLEPLSLNIASLLPSMSTNYKPLPFPLDTPNRRIGNDSQSEDLNEAFRRVTSSKHLRTKVFSGSKANMSSVTPLTELCIRVLQDNIDALEYTGGVPYLILKPIVEKATPQQLFQLEHYNPYLVEDTADLWELHCQKEFRNKKREEFESWRDMYLRCTDEREAKLKALTANIKQAQDKSLPVRTTKLAYVDNYVKPPRNIMKKQVKNNIAPDGKKPYLTPKDRLNQLAKAGEAGKVPVPNPGRAAVEKSSTNYNYSSNLKPKKAPLMVKTLSLLKSTFGRR